MRPLTPEVAAALERLRSGTAYDDLHDEEEYYYSQSQVNDETTIIDWVIEKFPPGHADEITPERLLACGFVPQKRDSREYVVEDLHHSVATRWWWIECCGEDELIDFRLHPRNMGEVWELLDRLGIEWRTKGGE